MKTKKDFEFINKFYDVTDGQEKYVEDFVMSRLHRNILMPMAQDVYEENLQFANSKLLACLIATLAENGHLSRKNIYDLLVGFYPTEDFSILELNKKKKKKSCLNFLKNFFIFK